MLVLLSSSLLLFVMVNGLLSGLDFLSSTVGNDGCVVEVGLVKLWLLAVLAFFGFLLVFFGFVALLAWSFSLRTSFHHFSRSAAKEFSCPQVSRSAGTSISMSPFCRWSNMCLSVFAMSRGCSFFVCLSALLGSRSIWSTQ